MRKIIEGIRENYFYLHTDIYWHLNVNFKSIYTYEEQKINFSFTKQHEVVLSFSSQKVNFSKFGIHFDYWLVQDFEN